MPALPTKIRCYRCNQLLGVPRSKAGAVVKCPKCSAELLVPEATEDAAPVTTAFTRGDGPSPSTSSPAASAPGLAELIAEIRPEDIRVEPGAALEPRGAATEAPPVIAQAPSAGPGLEDEYALTDPEPERPVPVPGPPFQAAPMPTPEAPLNVADVPVPPIRLDGPRVRTDRSPGPRPRDLLIPRSVVLAWSLFVLLALALAFVAGLLAGHYVWRVHERRGTLAGATVGEPRGPGSRVVLR